MALNPNPDQIWDPEFEKSPSLMVRAPGYQLIFQARHPILGSEGRVCLSEGSIRLFKLGDPNIVCPQYRGRVVVFLLYYCFLMGDRWRFDFSLIGFKPNSIIVCSDPQGGDAI